jgi:hypothetical protein
MTRLSIRPTDPTLSSSQTDPAPGRSGSRRQTARTRCNLRLLRTGLISISRNGLQTALRSPTVLVPRLSHAHLRRLFLRWDASGLDHRSDNRLRAHLVARWTLDLLCIRSRWCLALEHFCFFRWNSYTGDAKRRPLRPGIGRREVALLYGAGQHSSQDADRWGRGDGLCADQRSALIRFIGHAGGASRILGRIPRTPAAGLSLSPNGQFLLYSQYDQSTAEILLVNNFH